MPNQNMYDLDISPIEALPPPPVGPAQSLPEMSIYLWFIGIDLPSQTINQIPIDLFIR